MPLDQRTYWVDRMEAAHGFMRKVLACAVVDCGEPLACLKAAARAAGLAMVFPRGKHLGKFPRLFHLRRSLIDPALRVAEAFARRGYLLRIEDAYRSPAVQAGGARSEFVVRTVIDKVRWELGGASPTPEQVFRRLAVWSATMPIFANHTAGSAIDVTILRRKDGSVLDLGGPYPELSHRTPMDSPFVPPRVRRRREMVCRLFAAEGFLPYPFEFWHFSRGDADHHTISGAPGPARFGPVHWSATHRRPRPLRDIRKPLVTVEHIRDCMKRLGSA